MIVVDASVLVTALGDDGADGRRVRQRLNSESLTAPEIVDLEVLSAFRRLTFHGELDPARAAQAVDDLRDLRVELVSHRPLLPRCWELRQSLTVYDAVYVALAEVLDVPLVTADRRVAAATGPICSIEVLT